MDLHHHGYGLRRSPLRAVAPPPTPRGSGQGTCGDDSGITALSIGRPDGPARRVYSPQALAALWPHSGTVTSHEALMRAHAALTNGAAFVARHAFYPTAMQEGIATLARTRMLGNRLGELDRFLSILAEETALCLGQPAQEARAFARLRNTPNKLRIVQAMTGLSDMDHERLRAIGRIRACLHHCSGQIHVPTLYHDIALAHGHDGEHQPEWTPPPSGQATLQLTSRTLVLICQFYRAIGDTLVAEVQRRQSLIDFTAQCVHILEANVACE